MQQELILRKVEELFPYKEVEALAILDDCGSETWHFAKEEVQLAALKMSNGKLERLRMYMETARGDCRHLLLVAREPNTFRLHITSHFRCSEEEEALAQQRDEEQYESWLSGNHVNVCEHCIGVGIVPVAKQDSYGRSSQEYILPEGETCPVCKGSGNQPDEVVEVP